MTVGYSRYGDGFKLLWPIVLTASNNTLPWLEEGVTEDIEFTPGSYYAHYDATLHNAGYKSLYITAIALVESTFGYETYAVEASTPSGSELSGSGLTIVREVGSNPWGPQFGDHDCTIDPRLFGFGPSPGNQTVGGDEIFSPYSIYGAWQSPHIPSDLRDQPERMIIESGKGWEAATNEWEGVGVPRPVFIRALWAAHVLRGRGNYAHHAGRADLPTGDINNQWEDFWWGAVGEEVICIYSGGDEDLEVATHDYEIVKLRAKNRLYDHLEGVEGGERYNLRFDLLADPTSDLYDDP